MTNEELLENWRKSISIRFKTSGEMPMAEMFLVCPGEMKIDVGGKEETVLVFYQGVDTKGAPTVFLSSDESNNCYAFAFDSTKNTHVKSTIGRFVVTTKRTPKRNKKKK
jgi:hypothetical protein